MAKFRACWRPLDHQNDCNFTFDTLDEAQNAIAHVNCVKWVERLDRCEICNKTIVTQPATFTPELPIICRPCNEENMKGLE